MTMVKKREMTEWDDVTASVAAARKHGYLFYVQFYCASSACPVREIEMKVKDYDADFVTLLGAARARRCPVCLSAGKLKFHWAKSAIQHAQEEEAEARRSVTMQMRRRDHEAAHPDRLFTETVREMFDDRLPPTPPGWFDEFNPPKAGA